MKWAQSVFNSLGFYFVFNLLKYHVTCTKRLIDEHTNYKCIYYKNNPHKNIKILLLLNEYNPKVAKLHCKNFCLETPYL